MHLILDPKFCAKLELPKPVSAMIDQYIPFSIRDMELSSFRNQNLKSFIPGTFPYISSINSRLSASSFLSLQAI